MMKTKYRLPNLEKGQVIPILVIGMLVTIMMAALLVDGGALLSNRRTAQAAADAGALAGAQRLCTGETDAAAYAQTFVENNGAVPVSIAVTGSEVTVVTTVEHPSFFARILGEDNLQANAEAVAGCYPVSIAKFVLPIAFYYETPPIKGEGKDCKTDGSCGLVTWDFYELLDTLRGKSVNDLPLDYIYVVSDKTKICQQDVTGDIICAEMIKNTEGGSRTWIDLSPLKAPPANIGSIVSGGLDEPLSVYPKIWVNSQEGSVSAGYDNVFNIDPIPGYEDVPARLTYVPLFDKYCATNPAANCADPGDVYIKGFKTNYSAYRLEGFSAFVVTCVTKGSKCIDGLCIPKSDASNPTNAAQCPGYLATDPTDAAKFVGDNAIEGYFVEGFDPDAFGGGGVDGGLYIITLIK
jgi:hypothetical protein